MIFSSFPVYLDPPNWPQQQQQPNQEPAAGGMLCSSDQITQLPPALPVQPGVGPGSIRPGSMSDRARLAKIPQPEAGLKCPRCESTNTKFCYFNNYSLTQPRHFCKTCRRYWTRGGALRNVPVGGGCRRNKRSKGSNRSKSPSVAAAPVSSSTTSGGGGGGGACSTSTSTAFSRDVILSGHNLHSPSQVFPFLPPFNNFSDFIASDMGLNFGAMRKIPCTDVEFQVGTNTNSTSILTDQWRLQQFPSFQLSQVGLYPLEGDQGGTNDDHQLLPKPLDSGDQVPDIKMEEINCGLNTSKNFQGMTRISPYWPRSTSSTGNNGWGPDLSNGFSSSTDHLL